MHPIAVASIVCNEIGLGSTSICAALLHDVVEDTDYTVEDIENIFGPKIAQIVDGLTKISGGIFGDRASAQAENFKKLLLTMSNDIRVILIKIADRLHNMRTLGSMLPNKQYKIAGQFVRISQTPASIGERLLALVIDYFLIVIYVYSTATLLTELRLPSGFTLIFFLCVIYLPILGYSFLCETFNHGQSFGKRIMNIRVVKADGTTPSISSYLLRWLLFPIDGPITGGLGILVVLLTKNSQRMGDLAAGTMVIKEKNYRKIHVSLDEFDYLTKDYHPVYPQSADLSLEQVNVITRTLQSSEKDRPRRILLLAQKVQELLSITPRDNNQEKFLQTVLRDYQYYALEEI